MKYLIIGLESSCTKIVAKMIAQNLGIIKSVNDWDGHEDINNGVDFVFHRSFPHNLRDNYVSIEFANDFNYVILVTRDWGCSLRSKINNHHPDPVEAEKEHNRGITDIKDIVSNRRVFIFSFETAILLEDVYTVPFLKSLGIKNPQPIVLDNVNEKYLIG